jgi:galactitol 2-dehydrogenase
VAIGDVDMPRAEATAAEIGAGAYAVRLDVTDQASIDAGVAAVVDRAGRLDILINNAALFDAHNIVEITRASYDRLFSVNVAGTLFTLQAAARQMIAQGRGGKIINMASQAGRRGESLVAVYCATKAAVISLTQSAGLNLIAARHQRQRHRAGRGRRRALGPRRRDVRQTRGQEARPEEGRGRSRRSRYGRFAPPKT